MRWIATGLVGRRRWASMTEEDADVEMDDHPKGRLWSMGWNGGLYFETHPYGNYWMWQKCVHCSVLNMSICPVETRNMARLASNLAMSLAKIGIAPMIHNHFRAMKYQDPGLSIDFDPSPSTQNTQVARRRWWQAFVGLQRRRATGSLDECWCFQPGWTKTSGIVKKGDSFFEHI